MKYTCILKFITYFLFILVMDTFGQGLKPVHKLTKNQNKLVKEIAQNSTVRGNHGGTIALVPKQYSRFESLLKISSIDDLTFLLNHNSPAVRIYAFQGLLDTGNWQTALTELTKNPHDTATFYYKVSSMPGVHTVSYFMRIRLISYLENNRIILDYITKQKLDNLLSTVVSHEEEEIIAKKSDKLLKLHQQQDN
jgi:hypothetical protein